MTFSIRKVMKTPIGIFDSGYGGLTVFHAIAELLPQYDFIYLGDNARAPYGNRSFETVHEYTLGCVQWLFEKGCPLVILACNTASAKALRAIQENYLPTHAPDKKVLGVIRPTAEIIGTLSNSKHIGILGTEGTIASASYPLEIRKFSPEIFVHGLACPMWVPLIETGEYASGNADFFVKKYLDELRSRAPEIDTILLACTHYPLLLPIIEKYLPRHINVVTQGAIVARSLQDYLHRHPEMESRLTQGGSIAFFTTDNAPDFNQHASLFFGKEVVASQVHLQ